MPKFNFGALSPQDFEELMRDLLQAEWDVTMESFRCGRDRGIDLRYSLGPDETTIVQCKHFSLSGFSKLLAHLRNVELPKVKLLKPNRYVVATTVRLSPDNKVTIMAAMSPFILNEQDVIGGDDVESLLSRHPRIEKANFKLWLTSTAVMQNVLHNAERCRTDFEVERVQRKLPLFVRSNSFESAKSILDSNRVLIVSGPPGIGKTTLAEMLLFAHIDMGFEPIVIESEVKEGRALFDRTEKQIFYFDDFLGQTFLGDSRDYFAANRDRAIVDFMEMIRTSSESRFILTTREHILQSAVRLSERMSHSHILRDRIVLTMTEYSFDHRARMLYNHVYFSDLPQPHKEQIALDDFFLPIIRHKHFNPRLIEWLTSFTRVRQVSEDGYRKYILALLDDPAQLWEHAFNNQISEAARSALLCLYTVGEFREQTDFDPEFQAIHSVRAKRYNFRTSSLDFRNALRELDGAFFSYSRGRVSFLNPSVKEYVGSAISTSGQVVEDLLIGSIRMKQLIDLCKLAGTNANSPTRQLLRTSNTKFVARIHELLSGPMYRWCQGEDGKTTGATIDVSNEERLLFVAQLAESERSLTATFVVRSMIRALLDKMNDSYTSVYFTSRLLDDLADLTWFLQNIGIDVRRELTEKLISATNVASAEDWCLLLELPDKFSHLDDVQKSKLNSAFEHYKTVGVREDVENASNLEDKRGLLNDLERLAQVSGHAFGEIVVEVEKQIAAMDEADDELTDSGERHQLQSETSPPTDVLTDDQVREMFRTLCDEA